MPSEVDCAGLVRLGDAIDIGDYRGGLTVKLLEFKKLTRTCQ
jgi:hypothetical protein